MKESVAGYHVIIAKVSDHVFLRRVFQIQIVTELEKRRALVDYS